MAFVTPLEILLTVVLLGGFGGLAILLSDILKMHPSLLTIENPKRESSNALRLALLVFISTGTLEVFRFVLYRPLFHLDERPPLSVDCFDVIFTCLFYTPWMILLLAAMRRTAQDHRSIGIARITGRWRFFSGRC